MSITGENFIGFKRSGTGKESFKAFSPTANIDLPENFFYASSQDFDLAVSLAQKAFNAYKEVSATNKAAFLDEIAAEIMSIGDLLIERASAESGLPVGRITGERGRTCGQMKLFAQLLRDGWYVDARIDPALPDRQPLPRADIRRMLIPIGPVAVYGASNFPLAFSTAGGDTASSLAAGCPVIVKAHPSHPGTNELISSAIIKAAQKTQMPEGVFSSLYLSNDDSVKLAQHPVIKAIGFTGSRKVGMTLFNAAVNRPDPIPVYAEMSAINPVVLMEGAMNENGNKIAKDLAASVNLGVGQFCTNPGLVLMVESQAAAAFRSEFTEQFNASQPGTMLNQGICKSYAKGVETLEKSNGVEAFAKSSKEANSDLNEGHPAAFVVKADTFISNKHLSEEVFGPFTLFVICKDQVELHNVIHGMEGQLTATIHASSSDDADLKGLIGLVTEKAGRVIYNGFPTGVEVCHAMQHGGPFPSTSDSRSTSVGTAAIYRFLRPVAFQDIPDHLLPEALNNANTLNILRLVDGKWTSDKIN